MMSLHTDPLCNNVHASGWSCSLARYSPYRRSPYCKFQITTTTFWSPQPTVHKYGTQQINHGKPPATANRNHSIMVAKSRWGPHVAAGWAHKFFRGKVFTSSASKPPCRPTRLAATPTNCRLPALSLHHSVSALASQVWRNPGLWHRQMSVEALAWYVVEIAMHVQCSCT